MPPATSSPFRFPAKVSSIWLSSYHSSPKWLENAYLGFFKQAYTMDACSFSWCVVTDSCCSVSLVSESHAQIICQNLLSWLTQSLEQPVPVAVATSATQLKAIPVLQVPITWENGQSSIFSVIVVPNLAWSILFGQNHLSQTQAVTDHTNYCVRFNHQELNFTVNCRNSCPFEAFPSLASIPNSGGSGPGVNVTCLLISTPLPNDQSNEYSYIVGLILLHCVWYQPFLCSEHLC